MFKKLLAFFGVLCLSGAAHASEQTVYDLSFTSIDGEPMPLSDYRGKVIMVVNTASKCGFTGQLAGLQALYEKHKEAGLVIIGLPSNDFGGQEPGSNEEIKEFCENSYSVTFPLTQKTAVTGDDAHPFYVLARDTFGWPGAPKWNFHKYIIDRDGKLIDYFSSMTAPDSANLNIKIESALNRAAQTTND